MSRQSDVHGMNRKEECFASCGSGNSGQADDPGLRSEEEPSAPCGAGNSRQTDDPRVSLEEKHSAPSTSGIPVQLDIHPMFPDEVPAAVAIERAAMGEPWSAEAFLESLENPCAVCLAAVWEQTGMQAEAQAVQQNGMQVETPTAWQTGIQAEAQAVQQMGMQAETLAARQRELDMETPAARQGELYTDAAGLSHPNSLLAGYCVLYHAADEGEIATIAVCENLRHRGIADALLQIILLMADARGLESVWLEVRVSNVAAIHLYEKQGFAVVGKRKNFYRAPREDAFVMVRHRLRGDEMLHGTEERSSAC